MPRQNFFQQIISIAIIVIFLTGCNAQANEFTPTPTFTATAKVFPTTTATSVPTETATPSATPTPVDPFSVDKLMPAVPPKNMAEVERNCVHLPDAIRETDQFNKDVETIVKKMYEEILPTYTGLFLNTDTIFPTAETLNLIPGTPIAPPVCFFTVVDGKDTVGKGYFVIHDFYAPPNYVKISKTETLVMITLGNADNVDRPNGIDSTTQDDFLGKTPGIVAKDESFFLGIGSYTGTNKKFRSNKVSEQLFAGFLNDAMVRYDSMLKGTLTGKYKYLKGLEMWWQKLEQN